MPFDIPTIPFKVSDKDEHLYRLSQVFREISSILNERLNDKIVIADGINEPDISTDFAQIYVDSSDGDLKIKFGDGTIKTITTDT